MGILIGYMRVSKADGSQVLDLQKDALLAAGVSACRPRRDTVARWRKAASEGAHTSTLGGKSFNEGDTKYCCYMYCLAHVLPAPIE